MKKREQKFWAVAARTFFVPLLAYFLAAQTVLMPLSRAKAYELAGLDPAYGVLCLTQETGSTHSPTEMEGEKEDTSNHPHELGCCLPGGRYVLDAPVLHVSLFEPVLEDIRFGQPVLYILPQGRAPPAITATPAQARAPPLPA